MSQVNRVQGNDGHFGSARLVEKNHCEPNISCNDHKEAGRRIIISNISGTACQTVRVAG